MGWDFTRASSRRMSLAVCSALCVFPASAAAAVPTCPAPPASDDGTLTLTYAAAANNHTQLTLPLTKKGISWCGSTLPMPPRLVLVNRSADALVVDAPALGLFTQLQAQYGTTITLEAPDATGAAPGIGFEYKSSALTAPPVHAPQLRADGFDFDSDGDTDMYVRQARLDFIAYNGRFADDHMVVDATVFPGKIDHVSVKLLGDRRRDIVIDAPGAKASILGQGGKGGRFEFRHADTMFFDGTPGNDVVIARGVLRGGTANPGTGTDRLLLGPGPDSVRGPRSDTHDKYVDAGAGNDSVALGWGSSTVLLGPGNDYLALTVPTGEHAVVRAGTGNDEVDVGMGREDKPRLGSKDIDLGAGNDQVLLRGRASFPRTWTAAHVTCGAGSDVITAWGYSPGRGAPRACEKWWKILPEFDVVRVPR